MIINYKRYDYKQIHNFKSGIVTESNKINLQLIEYYANVVIHLGFAI